MSAAAGPVEPTRARLASPVVCDLPATHVQALMLAAMLMYTENSKMGQAR
ncbi:hypothetical protein [Thiobacillus sedimenti]|uniref:Uncharacterized protein n=1 Tax=Thiobacillus sedimenti TaxID=3110231 RepID=A0ABZ1CI23_9PROT|nr:hypothetical protein [Thiobacillus sp. SCUT-2]WRS38735.1 hypothetical protein VA613_12090 [Thiobacillus sp. SCUT-2]